MKKTVHISLSTLVLFLLFLNVADAFTFTRPMAIRDIGEDVLELQKILNSNPATRIVEFGPGSPGNETTFFGILTRLAVINFQNLHADKILTPVGLTEGTGFVGQSTLNFLNGVTNPTINTSTSTITSLIDIQNLLGTTSPQQIVPLFQSLVKASHPGKYIVQYRDRVLVDKEFTVASGFKLSDVDFFLGGNKMDKKCRYSEYVCDVFINKNTKPGTYTLSTNKAEMGTHQFKVVSMSVPYPEVSIDAIKLNSDVLIKGKDFGKNMIVSTIYGQYKTETSNNSFILNIKPPFEVQQDTMQGGFYVENEEGLQSKTIIINYEK